MGDASTVTVPVIPTGLHSGSATMNRRPTGGSAIARRIATPPQTLRFPCGHLEDQPDVTARTRETPRAVWVACRRCNVVALTIAPAPPDAPTRRRAATTPTL